MKGKSVISAVIFLLVINSYSVVTASDFGTPELLRERATSGMDFGFFTQKSKWSPDDALNWTDGRFTLEHLYAQFYRDFSEQSEGYIRIGMARFKSERAFEFGAISFLEEKDTEFQSTLDTKKDELAFLESAKASLEEQYEAQEETIDTLTGDEKTAAEEAQEDRLTTIQGYEETISDKEGEIATLEQSLTDLSQLRESNGKDFESNFKPFIGTGFKILFLNQPNIAMNFFVQGTLYSNYGARKSELIGEAQHEVSIDLNYDNMWDLVLGIGAQTKFQDTVVYGGVFAGASSVSVDSTTTTPDVTTTKATTFSNKNNVGVYGGVSIPVGQTFNVNLELEYRSSFSWGISIRDTF